jgi:hypothetical protein
MVQNIEAYLILRYTLFLEIGTFGRSLVYGLIKEDIAHLVGRHGLATKLFCRSD